MSLIQEEGEEAGGGRKKRWGGKEGWGRECKKIGGEKEKGGKEGEWGGKNGSNVIQCTWNNNKNMRKKKEGRKEGKKEGGREEEGRNECNIFLKSAFIWVAL